jgi:hypothetical protein
MQPYPTTKDVSFMCYSILVNCDPDIMGVI